MFRAKTELIMESIPRAELIIPAVDKITMDTVTWTVITAKNAVTVFEAGESPVYFSLTANGYENLSVNNMKTLTLIRQLRATINSYEEYYVRQTQLLDKYIKEQNKND